MTASFFDPVKKEQFFCIKNGSERTFQKGLFRKKKEQFFHRKGAEKAQKRRRKSQKVAESRRKSQKGLLERQKKKIERKVLMRLFPEN